MASEVPFQPVAPGHRSSYTGDVHTPGADGGAGGDGCGIAKEMPMAFMPQKEFLPVVEEVTRIVTSSR